MSEAVKTIEISRLGQRLEKTGAREVGIILLCVWVLATIVLLWPSNRSFVANYDGMYIAMTSNIFLFNLGAFALKTYGSVQEQRTRVIAARNPRLDPAGDVEIAG